MEATLQSCEHGQRDPRDEMFGPRRQFHMDGLRTGIRERVAINGSADSNGQTFPRDESGWGGATDYRC